MIEPSFRMKCGKIELWSVPLEFLFVPKGSKLVHVVTVNAEIFSLAHQDAKLRHILSHTVNTIDGRILQGVCKMLYLDHKILRQNGSNFVFDLAKYCRDHKQRLFLLGSGQEANRRAADRLRTEFPGIDVAGFSPALQGYPFDTDWTAGILDKISAFRPRHLVVCFGGRKQEYWIHENSRCLEQLGVRCAYGLGGTIDFLSRCKPRAPKWVEFIGAEWLFRLACEPRARFGRTLTMFRMPIYALTTARNVELIR
jgi:N-acetylglucosaminyldiphosphoundecaprenol N-acetyl-beta-D-mannosaminyltransferase